MFDNNNDNKNFNNDNNFSNFFLNNNEDEFYNAPFSDNFNNDGILAQVNNSFNSEQNIVLDNDLPPKLDEITYLNKEENITAPTLGALDQINVPDNYDNLDKLQEYENGSLYQSNFNNDNNFPISSSEINQTSYDSPINNFNMNNSFPISSNEVDQTSYDSPINNFNMNNSFPISSSEINQTSYDSPINNFNMNNNFPISSSEINQTSYDLPINNFNNDNNFSMLNNQIDSEYDTNNIEKNNIESENYNMDNKSENTNDEEYKIIQNVINNEENKDLNYTEKSLDIDVETKENDDSQEDYVIVQDEILSNETYDLLDDYNLYDEPDTLEIMDLDNDILSTENIKEQKLSREEFLSSNIEEIKQLVEQLKSKGAKINIDEFDFEEMYQLIIKLEK